MSPDGALILSLTLTHDFRRGLNNDAPPALGLVDSALRGVEINGRSGLYGLDGRSLLLHGAKMPELMRQLFSRPSGTEAFVLNLIRHSATTTHARATAARTWGPVRSMPSYFHGVPSALCVSLTLGLCTPDRVRTINVTMTHVFRRGLNNDARLRRWALLTLHCAQLKLMDEIDFYGLGGRSLLLHGAKMPELMRLTFSRPVGTRVDLPC